MIHQIGAATAVKAGDNNDDCWLVKVENSNKAYMIENSCIEKVFQEGVIPDTYTFVDEDYYRKNGEIKKKIRIPCDFESASKIADGYGLKLDNKIISCNLISPDSDKVIFCPPHDKSCRKKRLTGLIMCLGVFVIDDDQGYILLHYVTENDNDQFEQNKLDIALKYMKEKNFINPELWIYNQSNLGYQQQQDKSKKIVIEKLGIRKSKIHEIEGKVSSCTLNDVLRERDKQKRKKIYQKKRENRKKEKEGKEEDIFRKKYIKYKNKYVNLKKKINWRCI